MPSVVGCQSIGCKRWSNLEERASFHLRKTVHKSRTPPIDEATTMITVRMVLFAGEAAAPDGVPGDDEVAAAATTVSVLVCIDFVLVGVVSTATLVGSAISVEEEEVVELEVVVEVVVGMLELEADEIMEETDDDDKVVDTEDSDVDETKEALVTEDVPGKSVGGASPAPIMGIGAGVGLLEA
jgi:hypothetical protein